LVLPYLFLEFIPQTKYDNGNTECIRTLKLRLKDKHVAWLRSLAREVNQVFNFCNEVSMKASRPYSGKPKWLSGYDLSAPIQI